MKQTLANVETSSAGALTGARYIESLHDEREIWLGGERVDVTQHPAFRGTLQELARIYDLQHAAEYQDQMTYLATGGGTRVSYSYMLPRTPEQLLAKRRNTEIWAAESWGQLARAPDFMANVMAGLYDFRHELGQKSAHWADNVDRYYRFCAENDVVLTHSIVDPQIDRSTSPAEDPDLALHIVGETADGLLVRGAKQLATLAPLSNELLVYLSASYAMRESSEFVLWFAVPVATPGLKFLCRESFAMPLEGRSSAFANRFDEQDCMAFFDDVLVPWDRVFLARDAPLAALGLRSINAWSLYASQIRFHERIRTFIGVAAMMAKSIGIDQFSEIRQKLGELVMYGELVRLGLRGMEADARPTKSGAWAPGNDLALSSFAGQISMRLLEIVREIGASGLLMQPGERDLCQLDLRPLLERYMRGRQIDVDRKSRLFHLAWDLAGSSWGMRQELYERWNRGDLARNRANLYLSYDRSEIERKIDQLIDEPY